MTATNHALTGALVALVVKKPELSIPLAFASHFALDVIPHYNPPEVQKRSFTNFVDRWSEKLSQTSFVIVFAVDMLLLAIILLATLFIKSSDVSKWTVFFSAVAAISPDFVGGRYLLYQILRIKIQKPTKLNPFSRFHLWLQWMERPWGMIVEIFWFLLMIGLIHNLTK